MRAAVTGIKVSQMKNSHVWRQATIQADGWSCWSERFAVEVVSTLGVRHTQPDFCKTSKFLRCHQWTFTMRINHTRNQNPVISDIFTFASSDGAPDNSLLPVETPSRATAP